MQNITKIALVWELTEQKVAKLSIAKRLGIGRATVYRWLKGIEETEDLELFISLRRKENYLLKLTN